MKNKPHERAIAGSAPDSVTVPLSHQEHYEHACWNYLLLAFELNPVVMLGLPEAFGDLKEAARDIARARLVVVS